MTRRTIIIILGALILVALILASWFWLFSKSATVTQGLFGQSGNRTGTTTAQGSATNIENGLPGSSNNASSGGGYTGQQNINIPLGGSNAAPGASSGVSAGSVSPFGSTGGGGIANVPGVDWLGGTGTSSAGAGGSNGSPTSSFVPTATNQLNDGTTGGQVSIYGTPPAPNSTNSLAGIFAVAGIGTALCTAGLIGTGAAGSLTSGTVGTAATAADTATAVRTVSISGNTIATAQLSVQGSNAYRDNFLNCITRSIGRAIVNQITASVINWINGGFNGSPSFVQNYQQFFANVADLAAGNYIRGSALAFLCDPFQLQIRIAIAQSYANQTFAGTCSLSQVTQNVTNFINGNFSQGGWPALLNFTTIPTNNPYGAYAFAQIGLMNAQQQALANANRNITPGGFIGYVQTYDCTAGGPGTNGYKNNSSFLTPPQSAAQICPSNCKCKTATPGSVIEQSLINTNNGSADMIRNLGISGSFDAILSALITQLMTRTLQQGLSNLSGTQGYASNFLTPDQQQAQDGGNGFLTTLQAAQQVAQQYGQTEQGSITDIQDAQSQLSTLSNCWETISTSQGVYSSAQISNAAAQASSTQDQIAALEAQVAVHNNNITRANEAIVAIQGLQTQTLQITSTADLSTVQNNFNAATASGQLITQADVTQAQQDRTTLQGQLQTTNAQTASDLAQCKAVKPQATQ